MYVYAYIYIYIYIYMCICMACLDLKAPRKRQLHSIISTISDHSII